MENYLRTIFINDLLSHPGSRMEVYSPTLVAIDKGQKYARPVMLSRPLGSRVSSQVQFKIKPLTIHLDILLVKIGKLIINFG